MFNRGVKAYSEVSVDSAVNSANPVQLVVLLYAGAMSAISLAKNAMANKSIAEKSRFITKAISIVEGLRSVINHEQGGEIAAQLNELYFYIVKQLTLANLRNDPALLDETHRLLGDLHSAWVELAKPANLRQPASKADYNAAGSTSFGQA